MKQYIILISAILVSNYLHSQVFPSGTWSVVTDDKLNAIDSKSSLKGPRLVTSFDFEKGVKYSFSYEEYDSAGRRTLVVKENGVYSFTNSQVVLTPSTSNTSFYDYIPQSSRPAGSTVKQNPLSPAIYNWAYQKDKEEKLSIEAVRPGYREGIISGGHTKAVMVSRASRRSTPLVRQQVRSL